MPLGDALELSAGSGQSGLAHPDHHAPFDDPVEDLMDCFWPGAVPIRLNGTSSKVHDAGIAADPQLREPGEAPQERVGELAAQPQYFAAHVADAHTPDSRAWGRAFLRRSRNVAPKVRARCRPML